MSDKFQTEHDALRGPGLTGAMREAVELRRWLDSLRWSACLAVALGIHAAGAAMLVRWEEAADLVANAPLIMVELAMLPVAPDNRPSEVPPGPPQPQVQAQPQQETAKPIDKTVALPPPPQVEALRDALPPKQAGERVETRQVEKRAEKKQRPRHASLASEPSTAERRAERAAAPAPAASARNPDAVPNWKSQLAARLERFKRYPSEAQARGEQGVAQLAFSVDRGGGVHHARIVRSSGSGALDQATLSLIERATPMPPPPPEIAGAQIAISVPIRYSIR